MTNIDAEIIETLKRVEQLAFVRAGLEDRRARQVLYTQIGLAFDSLFGACNLPPRSEKRERLNGLWAKVIWGDPGFFLHLYPTFAYELTGQINWELFHAEREVPTPEYIRKVKHLLVVK